MRLVEPAPAMVAAALPWFDHPQVQRYLGGRDWLPTALAVAARGGGEVFRGNLVVRCHAWFGVDAPSDHPAATHNRTEGPLSNHPAATHKRTEGPAGEVGFVGGDVYADGRGMRSMGLGFVVDPRRWREGRGRALLRAATTAPEVADVDEFFCGIEPDNTASRTCCAAAGFVPDRDLTDEGFLYYRLRPDRKISAEAGNLSGPGGH
ncbi:GNAT family N-acetyltransferase [Nucisporomicrobium flavum]|uniref:GNAT family N-acetyltransferase n=1 Tax=Nucisporomicrobium flavum TaxID=2785915 RepID=UPI0018F2D3DE|nr:GNAT family protein [Nucisporomicrobium flavum]